MRYIPVQLVLSASVVATSLAVPGVAGAEPNNDTQSTTDAANEQQAFVGDPYPLSTDPVTGKELTDDAITHVHEQRQLRFNSEDTMKIFLQDPAKHLAEVDEKLVALQRPYYPLTTCPVSGGELGSMGEPMDIVVGNRLVRLCCAGCEKQVRENPEPIIAKLDAAVIKQQSDGYALEHLPRQRWEAREHGRAGELRHRQPPREALLRRLRRRGRVRPRRGTRQVRQRGQQRPTTTTPVTTTNPLPVPSRPNRRRGASTEPA